MSDKRSGRQSALSGGDNAGAKLLSIEALAQQGYQLRDLDEQGQPFVPEGAIVPQEDGTWASGSVFLTAVGLDIHGDFTDQQWLQIGAFLKRMEGSLQWLIGDWVIGCHQLWGDTYLQVVEQTGYEYNTVKDFAYVARNVPLSVRTDKLKFGHYKLLASLAVEEQTLWVNRAVEQQMSIAQLRAALKNPTPLPSSVDRAGAQKTLISREKPREVRQFLKLAIRAGQGDVKARQRALGQLVQLRQWMDDMEQWLKG